MKVGFTCDFQLPLTYLRCLELELNDLATSKRDSTKHASMYAPCTHAKVAYAYVYIYIYMSCTMNQVG